MTEPVEVQTSFPCNECPAGLMRLKFLSYFTWLDEELVLVPNFPAWVCDVCGKREYDERAVTWLAALLSPTAGKSTLPRKARRRVLPRKIEQNRPSSAE